MDGAAKILLHVVVGAIVCLAVMAVAVMAVAQLGINLWKAGPLALLVLPAFLAFYVVGKIVVMIWESDFGD